MVDVKLFFDPALSPSESHQRSHASNSAVRVTRFSGPSSHSSWKNLSITSVSERYSAVALSTAADVPSPL